MLPGPGPLRPQGPVEGRDEEQRQRIASRMLLVRIFMFMMLVSMLTSRRRPLHPDMLVGRIEGVDETGPDGIMVRGVWLPKWCLENPNITLNAPTPIIYAGREDWDRRHLELKGAAEAHPKDVQVLWLGDGITEGWRGTSLKAGSNRTALASIKKIWDRRYGAHSEALGIAGDHPMHLLWRLQHGELPLAPSAASQQGQRQGQRMPREGDMALLQPKACVVQIGTSDATRWANNGDGEARLEDEDVVQETLQGLSSLLCYLLFRLPSSTQILFMGLPTGPSAAPPGPSSTLRRSLAAQRINALFNDSLAHIRRRRPVQMVDCFKRQALPSGPSHLSPAGYEAWAECLEPYLPAPLPSPSLEELGPSRAVPTVAPRLRAKPDLSELIDPSLRIPRLIPAPPGG